MTGQILVAVVAVAVAVAAVVQHEEVSLRVAVVDQLEVGLGLTVIHATHVHTPRSRPHPLLTPPIRIGPLLLLPLT